VRVLEPGVVLAPVVLGEGRDPLAAHRAREQTRTHRRVDDDSDSLALRERQELVLGIAVDQRLGRLQRFDRSELLRPPQLLDVEVRDADVANEPLPRRPYRSS
jgi:hypothetical protein